MKIKTPISTALAMLRFGLIVSIACMHSNSNNIHKQKITEIEQKLAVGQADLSLQKEQETKLRKEFELLFTMKLSEKKENYSNLLQQIETELETFANETLTKKTPLLEQLQQISENVLHLEGKMNTLIEQIGCRMLNNAESDREECQGIDQEIAMISHLKQEQESEINAANAQFSDLKHELSNTELECNTLNDEIEQLKSKLDGLDGNYWLLQVAKSMRDKFYRLQPEQELVANEIIKKNSLLSIVNGKKKKLESLITMQNAEKKKLIGSIHSNNQLLDNLKVKLKDKEMEKNQMKEIQGQISALNDVKIGIEIQLNEIERLSQKKLNELDEQKSRILNELKWVDDKLKEMENVREQLAKSVSANLGLWTEIRSLEVEKEVLTHINNDEICKRSKLKKSQQSVDSPSINKETTAKKMSCTSVANSNQYCNLASRVRQDIKLNAKYLSATVPLPTNPNQTKLNWWHILVVILLAVGTLFIISIVFFYYSGIKCWKSKRALDIHL